MGGQDKGLMPLDGRPLITHVIDAVLSQVDTLLISANRNLDSYRAFGFPVVADMMGEFFGPLVGIASALQVANSPYVLSVPCDSPLVPADLCVRLIGALKTADADIGVAHDGKRMQPVFAVLRRELLPDLLDYLDRDGRKIDTWYSRHRVALTDFSDQPDVFLNINTLRDLSTIQTARAGRKTGAR